MRDLSSLPAKFIVAGIGTNVGKTHCAGFLSKRLAQEKPIYYWKPVQSGYPQDSDARTMVEEYSLASECIIPEWLLLQSPLSPHKCLRLEGKTFSLSRTELPPLLKDQNTRVIVELAGGVLTPLNEEETNLDLIKWLGYPVVLASAHYLGSLNHTLLTYEVLKREKIPLLGFFFLGENHMEDEEFLQRRTGLPRLGGL